MPGSFPGKPQRLVTLNSLLSFLEAVTSLPFTHYAWHICTTPFLLFWIPVFFVWMNFKLADLAAKECERSEFAARVANEVADALARRRFVNPPASTKTESGTGGVQSGE